MNDLKNSKRDDLPRGHIAKTGPQIRKKYQESSVLPPAKTVKTPSVSIIIACKTIGNFEKQCLEEIRLLDYPKVETIILPDSVNTPIDNAKAIATGGVSPSIKRNIGLQLSKNELIAFIDGDAYPVRSWLKNATSYFEDDGVGLVGGPSTP